MGVLAEKLRRSPFERLRADVSEDVVARRVGDEVVLVHLTTNQIFELNESAASLWELLASGSSPAQIRDVLSGQFDVTADELEQDILSTLESLAQRNLVQLKVSG